MRFNDFYNLNEDRSGGKKLSEYPRYKHISNVMVYRARDNKSNELNTDDYITLSHKFAIEHAENNHAVEEEPYIVIRANVSPDDVVDAFNPGEYFYKGKPIEADVVYKTLGDDYEGEIPDLRNIKPINNWRYNEI